MSAAGTARNAKDPHEQALLYRRWLTGAALAGAESDGLHSLTVARVTAAARVSRKVFYDSFSDVEDCLHAALEQVFQSAGETLTAAFGAHQGWREGTRAALDTLLALAEQRRALARVCVVESLGAGPRLLSLRQSAIARAQEAIDRAALQPGARAPAPFTAEALAGGIAGLLYARLLEGDRTPLSELSRPCMSMIVLPYFGPAAATRELARAIGPAQGVRDWAPPLARRPGGAGPRLTYRTVRVLKAIAERPGGSNREIARASGITDQGQASKLLKRLAARELIENTATDHSGNAWWLTDRGHELCASISLR